MKAMRSVACAMKAMRSAPASVPGYMNNVHSIATWVRCARPARLVPLAVPLATPRAAAAGRGGEPARRMFSAGPKLSTGDGYVKGQADSSTDIALQVRVMSVQMRARPGACNYSHAGAGRSRCSACADVHLTRLVLSAPRPPLATTAMTRLQTSSASSR